MRDATLFWIFNAAIVAVLALDLGVFHRKPKVIWLKAAILGSCFWIVMAIAFASGLYFWKGSQPALEFVTGYLIEESLSLDNLFVFIVLFAFFQVPREYEHKILFWGIIGALVTRAAFIFAGVALMNRFAPLVEYGFGAFLIYTGYKLFRGTAHGADPEKSVIVRLARRALPIAEGDHGASFFVRQNRRWMATRLFLVLLVIEGTDVAFAADSIPAILAVTRNVVVVYTSNVFAILGLRALYFALSGAVQRFGLLKYGLSALLIIVGVKMLVGHIVAIPIWLTLAVVGGIIAIAIVASIVFEKRRVAAAKRHA